MPSVGFEPTIPAGELPQTYAFDRATNETGGRSLEYNIKMAFKDIGWEEENSINIASF
jgi:hypothetical protein